MKATILIVDDEESIRYTFESFLVDEGHSVVCATSQKEARVRMAETNFDLIFADIILEEESGLELLRDVRQRNLNCPVIMITGIPTLKRQRKPYVWVRLTTFPSR